VNVMITASIAALPQHRAERLCLSVAFPPKFYREAAPRALLAVFCLLLSAFCFQPSAYSATWTRQTSGTMAWLHSVYFLDQNRGWVAGSNGVLLKTTDGGTTWNKVSTFTRDTLRDVYFADENHGWLLAERDLLKLQTNDEARSYLLKTNDGGITWQRVLVKTSDANVGLVRMAFADNQHGLLVGETGVVFATSDAGAHWLLQVSPTKHLLLGATFTDSTHAWLVGAGATIVKTSDGGATWLNASLREANEIRFNAASFATHNLGWAVGNAGQILTTVDGGRAWYAQRSNVDADLLDVKFVDAREGWATGSAGVLLHTTDAGTHWIVESSGTSHALQRLFFIDRNHGWAVGFGGAILTLGVARAPSLR
jgi:photosystem II stability/assembly factor-like uncharacterized protein